jgi:hypothetical protein
MKHTTIHTKYHKLIGARILLDLNGQCAPQKLIDTVVDVNFIERMVAQCGELPRYVIQPGLLSSMIKGSMKSSLAAMIEHNRGDHLPFKQVLVELEENAELGDIDNNVRNTKVRHFVWLSETDLMKDRYVWRNPVNERFSAICWTLIDDIDDPAITITPWMATCGLITDEFAERNGIPRTGVGSGTLVKALLGPQVRDGSISRELENSLINEKGVVHAFGPVNDALCAMVLLLHTKGIIADRIEVPAKLNKSRALSGKPMIQDHTVIRIGHVYNKSGEKVEYNSTGRTMPVHWRAGHWRNQRVGVGRASTRMVWIDPMLINYVEGDTPTPKPKELTI